MSRKRPSVFDSLDLTEEGSQPDAEAPASNVVAMPGGETSAAPIASPAIATAPRVAMKAKGRADVQHTSIYVPKAAYKKIRDIAHTEDRKAHDVIMEGLDMVLAKYGFPSLAEYKSGKKK